MSEFYTVTSKKTRVRKHSTYSNTAQVHITRKVTHTHVLTKCSYRHLATVKTKIDMQFNRYTFGSELVCQIESRVLKACKNKVLHNLQHLNLWQPNIHVPEHFLQCWRCYELYRLSRQNLWWLQILQTLVCCFEAMLKCETYAIG